MKIILKLLFIALFIILETHADAGQKKYKKLPLSVSLPYLKSIQSHAINLGKGPVDIYVFIDPKCPRSQEFITLISQSKKMQSLYSYHIYLYELKRFHSKPLIESIYGSKNSLQALLDVIVYKKTLKKVPLKDDVKSKIISLENVGKRLDVYKRPYLVLVRKGKK